MYEPPEKTTPDVRFKAGNVDGAIAVSKGPASARGGMADMATKANANRQKLFDDFLKAGASEADAKAALGPGWETRTPPSGPQAQPPTDPKVDRGAGRLGLTPPVGGLPNDKVEGVRTPVRPENGDVEQKREVSNLVPLEKQGSPAAPVGQRVGIEEAKDARGLDGSHAASSDTTREDGKSAVSRFAAGDPPAGWQAQVVETRAAYNEPGHTDNFLSDGNVVRKSKPKLLKSEIAYGAIRSSGLSRGELSGRKKKKTPEQDLRDSGKMTSEEVDAMKGALKKNPRSEEALQTDGTTKAVAKPSKKAADGTGDRIAVVNRLQ